LEQSERETNKLIGEHSKMLQVSQKVVRLRKIKWLRF